MKAIFNPYKKQIPEIDSIKITKEAFWKMNKYSSIVSEIIGDDKECLGTLFNYKNRKDNTARDIHLWEGQTVTSSSGLPSGVDDYIESEKRGMEIIGLWHSHGAHGVFHSGDDERVLTQMYGSIKNKIITGEKSKNIERIVEGETIRLFEEGSNKEIRIKGKIDDLSYIERDECYVLNSIVINRSSYSGGFINPRLSCEYDAEVWAGYDKKEYKRFKGAKLELVEETNNIILDEEELVKEAGKKVKFQGCYLKDLPNYPNVLDKYKRVTNVQQTSEPIGQIVNQEEVKETSNLTDKVVQEQKIEQSEQETIPNVRISSNLTYTKKLEEFYNSLSNSSNFADKLLAELSLTCSGKKYRFWTERAIEGREILKELKKRYLTLEQKNVLKNIKDVIKGNKYVKNKHPLIFRDIQRRLNNKNSSFYCNLAYWKDYLFCKPSELKKKQEYSSTLEKLVQEAKDRDVNQGSKNTAQTYNNSRAKKVFKTIAKYACLGALAAALMLIPAKYTAQENQQVNKPVAVYTVKKRDNIWNLTKGYLEKNNIKVDNQLVYKVVDQVAEDNGKGKQADYKIGGKEKKNPHHLKPGEKVKFSKKILDCIKKESKK